MYDMATPLPSPTYHGARVLRTLELIIFVAVLIFALFLAIVCAVVTLCNRDVLFQWLLNILAKIFLTDWGVILD